MTGFTFCTRHYATIGRKKSFNLILTKARFES